MEAFTRPLTEAEITAVRRFEERVEGHHRPVDAAHQALVMMLLRDRSADFVDWLSGGRYRLSHLGRIERVVAGRRPDRSIMTISIGGELL